MVIADLTKRIPSRLSRMGCLLAAGLVGTGMPAPAFAVDDSSARQTSRWSLPPANHARRSALLAAPSRMTQLLSAQGSSSVVGDTGGTSPTVRLSSAGYSGAAVRRADVATAALSPNVFGSTAMAIASTPLDAQWRRAGAAGSPGSLRQWTGGFSRPTGSNDAEVLGEVNRWVNARLTFTDDAPRAAQGDEWANADASLRRGRGDCEDYALAKMQLLSALGFDRERMYLVIVRDLARRADHAVLVVQTGGRFLVLDNMTDTLVDSNQISDYRPIMSYSARGRWLHGYERAPEGAPVQVAALAPAP